MTKWILRGGLLLILVVLIIGYFQFGLDQYLSLNYLKENYDILKSYYREQPSVAMLIFILAYGLFTTCMVPGATVLTLAGGAVFGFSLGTGLVITGSMIGASTSFLLARFVFGDFVEEKFHKQLQTINKGLEEDGPFYLFTLRLIPLFPYFIINVLMGLTGIRFFTYFWISLVGMLVPTTVYVNAGTQLDEIHSAGDILSPKVILSFLLIGFLPLIMKWSVQKWKKSS